MAVAGVPETRSDHAARAVAMAEDMLAVIAKVRQEHDIELNVRIGLASGPVLAGIIGTQKFSYDVWGDTVNLASRMEGSGVLGRIHVSPSTHAALVDVYDFEELDAIDIKGIGPLVTWLVKGKMQASAQ